MTIQDPAAQSKPKEKSPAFQFYPKDFLTDDKVLVMTAEERGYYITLLSIDWLSGGIREEDFATITGWQISDKSLAKLRRCFDGHPTKDDYVTNPRLQKERERQRENSIKRSSAGKKGAEAKHNKELGSGKCQDFAMANSSLSSSSSSSSPDHKVSTVKPKKQKASAYREFNILDFDLPSLWPVAAKEALASWIEYKSLKGEPNLLRSYQALVKHYEAKPELFISLVERATREGWKGLNEDIPFNKQAPPLRKTAAESIRDTTHNAVRAIFEKERERGAI